TAKTGDTRELWFRVSLFVRGLSEKSKLSFFPAINASYRVKNTRNPSRIPAFFALYLSVACGKSVNFLVFRNAPGKEKLSHAIPPKSIGVRAGGAVSGSVGFLCFLTAPDFEPPGQKPHS